MTERETSVLLDGLCFAEGPRWRDGRLYFSDMHDRKVMSVDPDGRAEPLLEVEHQPSGLGWLPDGRMLVVSMTDRRLLRAEGGSTAVHADLWDLTDFHCNDMVVDSRGNAYVGNYGFDLEAAIAGDGRPCATQLVQVTPGGEARKVGGPLQFPNGAVVSADGKTLVVAETVGCRLTALDIEDDGNLTNQRLWADTGGLRPDGLALDAEGAIWAAAPGSRAVIRLAEGGQVLDRIDLERDGFACALGGADGRILFVLTAQTFIPDRCRAQRAGRIETIRVDVPGAGLA